MSSSYGDWEPPAQPGRNINLNLNEVVKKLDDIAIANQRIADSLSGPAAGISSYRADAGRRDRYAQARSANVRGDDYEQQAAASEQELLRVRSESLQRSVALDKRRKQLEEASHKYETGDPTERLQLLERYGMMQGTGTNATAGGIPISDVQRAYAAQQAGNVGARDQNILNQINSQVLRSMEETIAREAPNRAERMLDAIEESGIKQLRYGQLPLQDLLRSAGTLGGRYYQRRSTAALDARDRVARQNELGLPSSDQDVRLAGRAERMLETGRPGALGGLSGLAAGAARILPVAGQVLSIGTIVKDILQTQFVGRYQDANRLGQVTGEGFGAGIRGRLQAFRMGMNPFDMISQEQARQIVMGVRQQGFSGGAAEKIQGAVAGSMNDLGTSMESTIQLYTQAVRQSGISVDEARRQFESFDDAAHQVSRSVQDFTDQFLAQSSALNAAGAGSASPNIAEALVRATPVGVTNQNILQTLFERARGEIAAGMGVPPQLVTSRRYARSAYGPGLQAALERNINQARMIVGDDTNAMATYLSQQQGGYFAGESAADIEKIIRQFQTGKGPSQQLELGRATRRYNQDFNALRGRNRETKSLRDIYWDLAGHMDPNERHEYARRRYGLNPDQVKSIFDKMKLGPGADGADQKMSVFKDQGDIPEKQIRSLRERAYGSIIDSLNDPAARKDIRSHLGDADFDVQKELQAAASKKGRRTGPAIDMATSAGSVVIRLKPGMENRLFELTREREQLVASGLQAPNTLPPFRLP